MDFLHKFTTSITVLDLTVTFRKNVIPTTIESNLDIRPIYIVVLASAVEGSFDVIRAGCN